MKFTQLGLEDSEAILVLAEEVNSKVSMEELRSRLTEMFSYQSYCCFGLKDGDELVAMSGGWMTTKFYSGKQLEVDNVAVASKYRSQGIGAELLSCMEAWAKDQGCISVELNTYVYNDKSHKFYFNQDYTIIGYHFEKKVNT